MVDSTDTSSFFAGLSTHLDTLFQIMTFDGWPDIARQVMKVYPWAWLPFVVFVIITSFVVVNLIIAVICDAIAALHDDDKAKLHGQHASRDITVTRDVKTLRESLTALEHAEQNLTRVQDETLQVMAALVEHLQQASVVND
jgi:voltage-gated sodium channel